MKTNNYPKVDMTTLVEVDSASVKLNTNTSSKSRYEYFSKSR